MPRPASRARRSTLSRYVSHLVVAGLTRSERCKGTAVGLEVDQWRAVEAVETAHEHARALDADQRHKLRPDRVRAHWRAEAESAARDAVVPRTLPDEMAAREMQPIEDLDALVLGDAVKRRDPGLENFDSTGRAVGTALARTPEAIRPWRVDAADEDQPGIGRRGRLDRHLAGANLVEPDHGLDHVTSMRISAVVYRFSTSNILPVEPVARADRHRVSFRQKLRSVVVISLQ